jgi:hypothetical protein
MLRAILVAVGVFSIWTNAIGITAGSAQTSGDWSSCKPIENGDAAGYLCPWGFTATRGGSTPTGKSSSEGARPEPQVVYTDEVGVGPDGQSCVRSRAVPLPDGTSLAPGTDFGNVSGSLFSTYPRCPPAFNQEAVIDPRVLALQGWEEVELPKPQPYIAPGWAITGKYAYLETRGQLRHVFTKGTPIGPLQITSTGRYYVDWGDGETTGPHSAEGGPWPDGEITHTYIDVGHYDVVVTEEWTAAWSLGPAGGSLNGQRTVGRIDDFRVEQIQVVVGP